MNDKHTHPRFSNDIVHILEKSGWFPERNVENLLKLPDDFVIFPAALKVLKEFGLLHFGERGPGIECARTSINCDPMLADGESELFREYSEQLHRKLYPIGEAHDGYYFLAIDESGTIFLLMDDLRFVHTHFEGAVENLLTGIDSLPVNDKGNW